MLETAVIVAASYAIASVPVAWIAGWATKGIDIRAYGSGNIGASNVWQSVSRALVVPVGLAQIGQGLAGPGIARLAGHGDGTQVICGLAALAAHNWCPWLRFAGGRGVGAAIGVLLVISPVALAVFIVVSVTGVLSRAIPQGVGLGLALAPASAAVAGQPGAVIGGCGAVAGMVLLKRVLANGPPAPDAARPGVWWNRLLYDRDVRDREAWVRRGLGAGAGTPPERG
ncbi:MAG TPA: glycerol-3-phosphate acyltransferase [Methylomirabilota bacterium]|nr:glycerol-3-phosphate acyltransferase [Methylomirabilota bacterium]